MPAKQYVIHLSDDERATILGLLQHGIHASRTIRRAQVLLLADGGRIDRDIAEVVSFTQQTVERIRKRYATAGLEVALYDRPRPGAARLLAPEDEAFVVAVACSSPPAGRTRWTVRLLADELIALGRTPPASAPTIGRILKNRR